MSFLCGKCGKVRVPTMGYSVLLLAAVVVLAAAGVGGAASAAWLFPAIGADLCGVPAPVPVKGVVAASGKDGAPPGGEEDSGKIFFKGSKWDPQICVREGEGGGEGEDKTICCGKPPKSCVGARFLHPSMKPLALCLGERLKLGGSTEQCPGGIGESFRTLAMQKRYRGLSPGWSLHNYGLAFDACCYFKSADCSTENLINKAVGGIKIWARKNSKVRCQAYYKMEKEGGSRGVVEKVLALPQFWEVLGKVKECYLEAGIKFGEWNWGVGWKDYFDAPHFQYFPAKSAGYHTKKSERRNGAHLFLRLLVDCYGGDRKALLESLYAEVSPVALLERHSKGCGKEAWRLYEEMAIGE